MLNARKVRKANKMTKSKNLIRILMGFVVLSMIVSIFFSLGLSAAGEDYYGTSPSISRYEENFDTGYKDQLNSNVMFKLPDTVNPDEKLSLIINMPTITLLDAYDGAKTDMSFTEYVTTDIADAVREGIKLEIDALVTKLDESGVKYTYGDTYDTVLSGFEIEVKASEFEKVCNAIGKEADVIIGDEYEEAKTELVENNVNVYETGIFNSEDFGYDGSGTVVAVLDTGLDYYHSAFSLGNFTSDNRRLTPEIVAGIINGTRASEVQPGLTASDVYISEKVPYGFDYADRDSDVFPLLSNHGTHVAGVIAGKDDVITGVAPNAQLVIMKIFSDVEATARASRIITALEDCVALGVDVINMSIGTSAGFSRPSDKELLSGVYDKIRERGISLVVAASNSFNSTYASEKNGNLGLTSNPDSGTVGSPATYLGALSVASINGAKTPYLSYQGNIIYFNESNDRVAEEKDFVDELLGEGVDEIEMPYVTIPGAGRTADYTGIDVTGKIVLIKRGYTNFEEKVNIAEEMGAAGVIVYNNVSGDIKMNVGEVNIPSCSISQDDGEVLAAAKTGILKISRSQKSGPFISDFSSWGPTPDLKIKPEITAHGGMILSSVPGQSYDRISGTSMACPNISGVAAILRQYVKESEYFSEIANDPAEVTATVNRLMMSTADIIINKNGLPYAVRKQGAGLANLTNTKATTAYILTYDLVKDENGNKVYDLDNPMEKPKIELGDDPGKKGDYELVFSVKNFGSTSLTYNVGAYVLTEGVSDTKTSHGETTVTETAYSLDGASITVTSVQNGVQDGSKVTVAEGTTATITVRITLSDADKKYLDESFENGMYVEGFVTLEAEGEAVDLSVPYLAFYGDWTRAPLFDLDYFETSRDELDETMDPADKNLADAIATRPVGGVTGDYMSYLGSYYFIQDPSKAIISADRKYVSISNQENAINSLKYVWAGMLRSASKIHITITEDSTGEIVYDEIDEYIRKSYGDGGPIRPANIDINFSAIEENLKNNTAYTVKLKAYLDYGDGGENTNLNNEFTFPLVTDFEAPTITDCEFYTEYDRTTKKTRLFAKMAVYDNHYSMAMQIGLYDGISEMNSFGKYYTPIYSTFNSESYVVFELTDYLSDIIEHNKMLRQNKIKNSDDISFSVVCYDYALNLAAYEIALPDDYRDFYFEEETITISPNETYTLSPVVYPATEWSELINYETNKAGSSIVRIVGNRIVGLAPGTARITARYKDVDGKTLRAEVIVHVLAPDEPGYKKYDKPVTDKFEVTGYYVNKAFYQLDAVDREIGMTGSEVKFGGNYSLSMYPSESITLRYDLNAFFPDATEVVFESSNDKIVTVDKTGKITAVDEGLSSITVKVLMDGKSTYYSKSIDITVKDPYVTTGPSITHYYGAGNNGVVSIPKDLAVTEIGDFAFSNFDYVMKGENDEISEELPESMKMWYIGDNSITRVEIPEGIKKIGAYAFANLTALKSIKLPSTLETIDYGAFIGCTALETVEGIGNVKFINQSAFEGCSLKGEIRLDKAVAIADRAFAKNDKLTSVVLSETTQSVGAYAFAANSELTTLTVNADIIKLGKYAFTDCKKLSSAKINAAVIPEGAFNNCEKLTSFTIGKDVEVISEYAFTKTGIASFNVEEGNRTYAEGVHSYIVSADGKSLLLVAPKTAGTFTLNGVTTVASGAFSGNVNIEKIVLPDVTRVERFAFSECSSLKEIELGTLTYIGEYAFERTAIKVLPSFEALNEIGRYAFSETKITSVSIPNGVRVGEGAFKNCHNITTVSIGDGVTVGKEAFALDRNNIVSPAPYYDIGDERVYYYEYKSLLTALTIGKNVDIGERAFLSAAALTSVTLGDGAKIGNGAFLNNTKLESIDLSKAVYIGDSAFSGYIHYEYSDDGYTQISADRDGYQRYRFYASALKSIDLSSVEFIGEEAFAYCESIESVILNEELTEVSDYAFAGCSGLSSINLDKLVKIGAYAFTESKMTVIDLPTALEIGEYAFCDSETVKEIKFCAGVDIGEGAFSNLRALVSLSGEEGAVSIGDYAFANTALTEATLTSAEYVGSLAFIKEAMAPFSVDFGDEGRLLDMGDNPFAYCELIPFSAIQKVDFNGKELENVIYTYDISDNIKVIDGSLYRVVPNGLELITWCGSDSAEVAEGTVRISAMSFIGTDVNKVVLPYELRAIGHKAFFDCDKLTVVTFKGFTAPILEEEYDYNYYIKLFMEEKPASLGDYSVINSSNNSAGYEFFLTEGLGIVPFYTYDFLLSPANVFYGANFKNYVGFVDQKISMIRPSNGKNYDSFIFNQYFDLKIDGKAAPDEITLEAIAALKGLPQDANTIKLSDKALIESVRAAFDRIAGDEQRGLVPDTLVALLKSCEQMISDLEYLASGDKTETPEEPEVEDNNELSTVLIVLIVVVIILAIAVIALTVFFILFVRKITKYGLPSKNNGNSDGSGSTGGQFIMESPDDDDGIDIEDDPVEETVEEEADTSEEEHTRRVISKPVDYDDITVGYLPSKSSVLKKRLIIGASAFLASALVITGVVIAIVNANKGYYSDYDDQGYTVSVTFDSAGGTFKGSDSSIVDLYKPEMIGEEGIKLLAPDDSRRDKNNVMTLTKPGYFLAGWYKERTPIDANDPDKGYTYSGKWDFSKDRLYLEDGKKYSADESALTLYAAWVPYYSFEIYTKGEDGQNVLLTTASALELTIPEWKDGKVTLNMGNFPEREGYTLDEVFYLDTMEKVEPLSDASGSKKYITGEWDSVTATSKTPTIKLFTTWQEGKVYRIYSVDDLIKNADINGYYEIYDNLNFSGEMWPAVFTNSTFNGKFVGKTGYYSVSNVNITATSINRNIGLFAELGENASIESLEFKNIKLTVDLMSAKNDSSNIGLFAGSVKEGASFDNVKISGSMIFTDNCSSLVGKDGIVIKKVVASGEYDGITVGTITASKAEDSEDTSFNVTLEGESITLVSGS